MCSPVIDCHAHLVPMELLDAVADGRRQFAGVEVSRTEAGTSVSFDGGSPTRPVMPGLRDAQARTQWMDRAGIDHLVASGWLDIFGYQLGAEVGTAWSRALNEAIVAETARDPRLSALGTVPLQDGTGAASVLRELVEQGVPGVMIATQAGETELDDPALEPFWQAAHDTGAVVFIHPGFRTPSSRYDGYPGLINALARVEDTTITLTRLLYAGLPARYPDARLLVSHGGAALPMALGRLSRNHQLAPDELADPRESFAHLYFDSVVFEPAALRLLVELASPGHVLLGTDYPFPIGDLDPCATLRRSGLVPEVEASISSGAAMEVLGLTPERVGVAP